MSGRGRGKRLAKTIDPEDKPVKKQGRKKQFPIVAVITPDGIEGNLLPETRKPLIVHLPIQSKEVTFNDMHITYDPKPPTDAIPYDSNADNPFYECVESVEQSVSLDNPPSFNDINVTPNNDKPVVDTTDNSNNETEVDFYNMKSTLLVRFSDSNETKTIPEKSDAACFWCCHTFTNRPVVLPTRDTGEHLIVTGNFCCPECALAYLFDIHQDSHTRWDQLSLLYRVYGDACLGKIHPAPPRAILKMFGGNLSIQEYRALMRSQTVRVDIHLPPMVSILATMDTKPIDFYDSSLTKNVNETIKERLHKAEEVLRLRRTKPLKAWESTLDACINLKIK